MKRRVFIPLYDEDVAPRFDLATEVLMAECSPSGQILREKVLILPGPSAERLCHMIITEGAHVLICGGIEQEFYDYLTWKRITVIDNVIGRCRPVLERFANDTLASGDVIGPSL